MAAILLLGVCGAASAQEASSARRLFYQDFRGRDLDQGEVRFEGPDAAEQVKVETEGLRIRLPGKTPKPIATGVAPVQRFTGDCSITMTYELLRAEPRDGTVAGVTLYLMALGPQRDSVLLGRFNRPGDKMVYTCQRSLTNEQGKRQHIVKSFSAATSAGRLRIVRRGSRAALSVAEQPDGEFRELQQFDFSAEDLHLVRVAADNGTSDNVVDVRIRDLEVHEIAGSGPEGAVDAAGPSGSTPRRWWLSAAAVVIVVLLAAGGLALCLYPRRWRGGAAASFTCPRCGQAMAVAAAQAGKRVRCPQCRETVRSVIDADPGC